MTAIMIIISIIAWFMLCLLIGKIGGTRNIGWGWGFTLAFLFSPLIGILAVLLSDKKESKVKYREFLEAALRLEFREDWEGALVNYKDALYHLEFDFPDPPDFIIDRRVSVKKKIDELKEK